jgi:membrane dipeptidase
VKMYRYVVAALALFAAAGCTRAVDRGANDHARRLAHDVIIADGHVDVPYRLVHHWEDVSGPTTSGQFDYPRAREGGLDAPFMSIYTPAELETQGGSRALAETLIDTVDALASEHPDEFAVATSPADVEANHQRGVVSLCIGMENGSPIEGELANVQHFYDRGVRYITLTHGKDNHICDSSYDTTRTWHGLSDFGRKVVLEMNRVGIMVDVSHVSDDAFWQVMDLTRAPVIASHSSCRYYVPGFERDMSDDMIRRVAEGGGVVLVNFGSSFLTKAANEYFNAFLKAQDEYLHEHHYSGESEEAKTFRERYLEDHPFPFATVDDVADHIDHIVSIAGVDHAGLGSDFEGVGESLPVGLKDVSQYPNLIGALSARGYSDEDIAKIAGGNLLRVWREVEQVAERLHAQAD